MMKRFAATDLVDRIPVPAAMTALQAELDTLRDERDAAMLELEAINVSLGPGNFAVTGPLKDRQIQLQRRLAEINAAIVTKRTKHGELRARHLEKVRAFMQPHLEEQKTRIAAAFGDFLAEISALDVMTHAGAEVLAHVRSSALTVGMMQRHVLAKLIGEPVVDAALRPHGLQKRRAA